MKKFFTSLLTVLLLVVGIGFIVLSFVVAITDISAKESMDKMIEDTSQVETTNEVKPVEVDVVDWFGVYTMNEPPVDVIESMAKLHSQSNTFDWDTTSLENVNVIKVPFHDDFYGDYIVGYSTLDGENLILLYTTEYEFEDGAELSNIVRDTDGVVVIEAEHNCFILPLEEEGFGMSIGSTGIAVPADKTSYAYFDCLFGDLQEEGKLHGMYMGGEYLIDYNKID